MTPFDQFLARFPQARPSGQGWMARCPAHDDRTPSLSITEGDDGRVLVKCHAGCPTEKVVRALGMEMADLRAESHGRMASTSRSQANPNRRPSAKAATLYPTLDAAIDALSRRLGPACGLWKYHDAQGVVATTEVRFQKPGSEKEIRQVTVVGNGWAIKGMDAPRPLYRLGDLTDAPIVIVTEGGKCADAARFLGFTATTSSQGADSARLTDWSPLAGKEVVILPDNDDSGEKYAHDVTILVTALSPPATVRIVRLPGLAPKGDIADLTENSDEARRASLRAQIDELIQQTDPIIPDQDTLSPTRKFVPFPTDLLPEPVASFVKDSSIAIGCDASFIALPLLVACAAAIGNTRRLRPKKGWLVPPVLWGMVVGESGTAKSPALDLALRGIEEIEKEAFQAYRQELQQYARDLEVYERDFNRWRRNNDANGEPPERPAEPRQPRLLVKNTTIEALLETLSFNPRGLLLADDELAGWFGGFDKYSSGRAQGDAPRYLSMFNAKPLSVDRKTGKPKTLYVPNSALCITGGIQPLILKRVLGEQHRESGLAARFLMAFPPRQPKHWTDAVINEESVAVITRLIEYLHSLEPASHEAGEFVPCVLDLSPDARRLFSEFVNRNGAEQMAFCGDLSAAWSKLEEYPARLALVIQCIRKAAFDHELGDASAKNAVAVEGDCVDETSMRLAIGLVQWFKEETQRVYGFFGEEIEESQDKKLIELVERKGGSITPREAQQGARWLKTTKDTRAALERLVASGEGRWEQSGTGRQERFVLVSPPPVQSVDGVDAFTSSGAAESSSRWGAL